MNLKLVRTYLGPKYTIGHLYINDKYFCDTIEDTDRGLNKSMPVSEILRLKVKHKTAIPTGIYTIAMGVKSPKYSTKQKYKFTEGRMPRLLSVPGFDGILIHPGTTQDDSSGCLIVGQNKEVGKVINSYATFTTLWTILNEAYSKKERIIIEIIRK